MAAIKKREDILRERMSKTFKAIETFYSLKSDVAEFLVQNWGAPRFSQKQSTFADRATSDKYKLAAMVRAAQSAMLELEQDNLKFNLDRRTLWNSQIGGSP